MALRGPHNVGDVVLTQPLVSISSGESELYSMIRGAIEALYLRNVIEWLDAVDTSVAEERGVPSSGAIQVLPWARPPGLAPGSA